MKTDPIRDAPYEYAPLDRPREQIRVITDIHERPSGELQLQLQTKDLISSESTGLDRLKFIALSYTWGKPGEVFYVWVGDRRLPVQRNAFTFLNHYRTHFAHNDEYLDSTLPIWIDAICINQKYPQEKGQQVSIMGEIYKRAYRVYVWLDGCSDDKTFRTLYNRHLQCVGHRDGPLPDEHRDCVETPTFGAWLRGACICCADHIGRIDYDGKTLKLWSSIISHTYWTRIWIIQELSLAQSPPEIILWDTSISVQLVNKTEASEERFDGLRVDSMIPMSHGPSTLTQLLGKFSDRGCVDARDIVYALLSMTPYAGSFDVDYEEGAEGLICRALPLMLQERDRGRPSSTVLKDDSLVKLLKVLAMFHSTQLVELCKSMPSEHAAAFQEPHYEIRARRLSVLTLTELKITQTTISNYSTDWETILPSCVTLTTSTGTSCFQCLDYHMALGTYTEPDKKTVAVDCAMVFELLDLPIVDGERCFFNMLIAARDGQIEVLCYIRGDHLHPMPSDIKARWQDHLIREGKPWQSICCDFAWDNEFDLTLPCSLVDAAHLSELEDMLIENKELEGDVYDMVDSTSIPDAVRKMCPPAAPLLTLPM